MKDAHLLGIDFGEKRIGLALSDPLLTFAYSFKTLPNNKNIWYDLGKIILEKKIDKMIIGIPDKKRNKKLANLIQSFIKEIIKRFNLEVITWNEEFTSVIAQEKIIQSAVKKKKRRDKGLVDRISASIILQEYLDSK